MIVDLHSHYVPLETLRQALGDALRVEPLPDGGHQITIAGQSVPLSLDLTDLDRQVAISDAQGIDRRAISVQPGMFLYELPPELGRRWARALNEGIAQAVRARPDRFIGLANVPLQDVPAAVAELEHAVRELGLRGVEIASNIHGIELDAPALDPFWAKAEALRTPILIHPHYVAGGDHMDGYHLRNLIGNPTETARAGARLLFGGVLERYPGLRIVLAHGGGALPHIVGRLQHGYEVRPEAKLRAKAPIEHLRRLYYDTIVFDPMILRHLVEVVGASQVVLGSDHPFDMAEARPVEFVRGAGLAPNDAETILRGGERLFAA